MFKMVESQSPLAIHDTVHNYPDQFEMCGLPFYEQGSPIGFLNPTIPTKIFPLSRNLERFYRPIPIPVIFCNYVTSQHDVQINSVGAQGAQAHYMNADLTLACERCCVLFWCSKIAPTRRKRFKTA